MTNIQFYNQCTDLELKHLLEDKSRLFHKVSISHPKRVKDRINSEYSDVLAEVINRTTIINRKTNIIKSK
jgi:hypothetical protein